MRQEKNLRNEERKNVINNKYVFGNFTTFFITNFKSIWYRKIWFSKASKSAHSRIIIRIERKIVQQFWWIATIWHLHQTTLVWSFLYFSFAHTIQNEWVIVFLWARMWLVKCSLYMMFYAYNTLFTANMVLI